VAVPREDPRIALNIDLARTIVRAAGIFPPPPNEGLNLGVLLQSPLPNPFHPWREDFLIEHWNLSANIFWPPDYAGVRTASDAKYVAYGAPDNPEFEELYDLDADPYELDNLLVLDPAAPLVQARTAALRQRLGVLRPE
jgi:arylsulfatase A-like enzyme